MDDDMTPEEEARLKAALLELPGQLAALVAASQSIARSLRELAESSRASSPPLGEAPR